MGFIKVDGKIVHTSHFDAAQKLREDSLKHTVKVEDVNKAYNKYVKVFNRAEKLKKEFMILDEIYQAENGKKMRFRKKPNTDTKRKELSDIIFDTMGKWQRGELCGKGLNVFIAEAIIDILEISPNPLKK